MTLQEKMVEVWNKGFMPGTNVLVEKRERFEGKTTTPAWVKDGEAMIYVDAFTGPIPLAWVRPKGKGEEFA